MASTTANKFAHLQIPLEEVVNATNNFHDDNIIGRSGLIGPTYKGQLLRDGKLIKIAAVRLIRKTVDGEIDFWAEVSTLSDLQHSNLPSIIGVCDEKDEKIIITTHAVKGSLKGHLNSPNLTWTQRLKICIGVARALSYLHHDEGRGYSVIHRYISSSTILLDENLEAKLSGFMFSVKQSVNRMDQDVLCDPIGIYGYVDPATKKGRGVSPKLDIYSLGVVLFEILCGRRAYIKNDADAELAPLARCHYEKKTLKHIIHPDLWNQMFNESLLKYSQVAYACLEEERAHRPDMVYIVNELEKALELQLRLENLVKSSEHLKIRLSDIKLVTNDFSDAHRIWVSSYCIFYRARISYSVKNNPSNKHELDVLIKRVLPRDDKEGEEIFFTEIEMLTTIKHPGIISLFGFCDEGSEKILVHEFFF